MKIRYNSPVILTFSLTAVLIHAVDSFIIPNFTHMFFVVGGYISFFDPLDYIRLVSHVLGHSSWRHLFNNLTFILLLGPILEEKYGSLTIFEMIFITALFTGIFNIAFFSTGLLGASGVVFMLIILCSIVDIKKGAIPLTFILVSGIFIGTEVLNTFRQDNISQMAHIVGGLFGAIFGFLLASPLKEEGKSEL